MTEPKQILAIANTALLESIGRSLSDLETAILLGAIFNRTYEQISQQSGYSISYIKRDVGPKLWRLLSIALGEKVSKTNFRQALERYYTNQHPRIPSPSPATLERSDSGKAPDTSCFLGRTAELNTLVQSIVENSRLLVAMLDIGDIDKIALRVNLKQQIQGEFESVIWDRSRNAPPPETLLTEIVSLLCDQQETRSKMKNLPYYFHSSKCLLILDNLEAIVQPDSLKGFWTGYDDYGKLLRLMGELGHLSCLIVTSREKTVVIATKDNTQLN